MCNQKKNPCSNRMKIECGVCTSSKVFSPCLNPYYNGMKIE